MKINQLGFVVLMALVACTSQPHTQVMKSKDIHSYSELVATVTHLNLDATIDFNTETIRAKATWYFKAEPNAQQIVFDTYKLKIVSVTDGNGNNLDYQLSEFNDIFGSALTIALSEQAIATGQIIIEYQTDPSAPALQWLSPEQTFGKQHPFLYTQGQAILTRSYLPVQDSPAIRFTYNAKIKVPNNLMAVMSAQNGQTLSADGVYTFIMDKPIPSYLMALAVGNLKFEAFDERCGVYAEPEMLAKAAYEFAQTPEMVNQAEVLYGTYPWNRYDLLLLPPAFPFGGMENPCLTFVTPSILAGDRSLTSLVAHELAHSWSGNLVTNATWSDFWLNEGFTVYFERRIAEKIFGTDYADMLAALGYHDLQNTIKQLGDTSPDTHLYLNLEGRSPDDGVTDIAYEKGYFLLRTIELAMGRQLFDSLIAEYFKKFAFNSVTTQDFIDYFGPQISVAQIDIDLNQWIYNSGLPNYCTEPTSDRFAKVDLEVKNTLSGKLPTANTVSQWSSHEWLRYLHGLQPHTTEKLIDELNQAFALDNTQNAELRFVWLQMAIAANNQSRKPLVEAFLKSVGRRKFVAPTFAAMAKQPNWFDFAKQLYQQTRPTYHYVTRRTVDDILGTQL